MNNKMSVVVIGVSLFVLCTFTLFQMQGGQTVANAVDTIRDVDFNSPLDNNTYDLGEPFLVEYDNTTGILPPRNPNYIYEAVFSGNGTINGTRYTDSGVSSIDYSVNGTVVYQNGTIDMTTETGEKATLFLSLLDREILQLA